MQASYISGASESCQYTISEGIEYHTGKGPFECCVTQIGVGGVNISRKKRYEGVRFNVISVTRRWVGVQFPGKKRYVTIEWPLG